MTAPDFDGPITVAVISNSDAVLERNLLASPPVAAGGLPVAVDRNPPAASVGLDRLVAAAGTDVVVLAHNDVYLPRGWDRLLRRRIAEVASADPDWALIGAYGVGTDGWRYGPVWSSSIGEILGRVAPAPVEATSFDEHLIVLRRSSGVRFDDRLPSFHLYGTDLPLAAREAGLRAWLAPLPLVHNDRFKGELGHGFAAAYRYMQRKWRHRLPVVTPVTRLSWHGLELRRSERANARSADFRRRMALSADTDPAVWAERCGWGDVAPRG